MDLEIKAVENMVKIAVNANPKNITEKEKQLLSDLTIEIQKKLIGYRCLRAAVQQSKCNKKIAKKAEYYITVELEKIAKGEYTA